MFSSVSLTTSCVSKESEPTKLRHSFPSGGPLSQCQWRRSLWGGRWTPGDNNFLSHDWDSNSRAETTGTKLTADVSNMQTEAERTSVNIMFAHTVNITGAATRRVTVWAPTTSACPWTQHDSLNSDEEIRTSHSCPLSQRQKDFFCMSYISPQWRSSDPTPEPPEQSESAWTTISYLFYHSGCLPAGPGMPPAGLSLRFWHSLKHQRKNCW